MAGINASKKAVRHHRRGISVTGHINSQSKKARISVNSAIINATGAAANASSSAVNCAFAEPGRKPSLLCPRQSIKRLLPSWFVVNLIFRAQ